MKRTVTLLLFILLSLASRAQLKDSSVVWIDDKVMIVAKSFPYVLDLKESTGFKVPKGTKYLVMIVKVPDETKAYNINVAAYPIDQQIYTDTIDDRGPETVYKGKWVHAANYPWNDNHYKQTISFTEQPGAYTAKSDTTTTSWRSLSIAVNQRRSEKRLACMIH
jgi:hypothetical protein